MQSSAKSFYLRLQADEGLLAFLYEKKLNISISFIKCSVIEWSLMKTKCREINTDVDECEYIILNKYKYKYNWK